MSIWPIVQRAAFGLAEQRRGADDRNRPGRRRSNAAAGEGLETIVEEILRRLAMTSHVEVELVREAVGDAMDGRRPGW